MPIHSIYALCEPGTLTVRYVRRLGISQRAIVNACKREGWPWRKIYGRIWVCADFADRYEAKYGTL